MKKCGYSFWGYLGDIKFTRDGREASTPDGNAFYSWCIIGELQKRGYEVTQLMPDRDEKGFELMGEGLFESWVQYDRLYGYRLTEKVDLWDIIDGCRNDIEYHKNDRGFLVDYMKSRVLTRLETTCDGMDFILHEYRMEIPGRNDISCIFGDNWQPDYLIQECIFDYCISTHKKLILFDLDYKLDYGIYEYLRSNGCPVKIFELGMRWQKTYECLPDVVNMKQVYIPFDFNHIDDVDLSRSDKRKNNLIYVGNRYERDWCIDKYIPEELEGCVVYGNWLESGRDSHERWPYIEFGKRLQTRDMRRVYANSVATVLLAKREYCDCGFMTARILESVFYGTVPLFIEEYGNEVIQKYAGIYSSFLKVKDSKDVYDKIYMLRFFRNGCCINEIIKYLRDYLNFMDVKYFVDAIEEVL